MIATVMRCSTSKFYCYDQTEEENARGELCLGF
jgi:hypothetical protein